LSLICHRSVAKQRQIELIDAKGEAESTARRNKGNTRMFAHLRLFATTAVAALALSACGDSGGSSGGTRDYVSVAGSSTVYPYATAAAEEFARANAGMTQPRVESIGTGGGIERFCAGIGANTPDIATASRRMKPAEFATCAQNGVTDIVEIRIGIDGLALAESVNGPRFQLTREDIYRGLAANPFGQPNTATTWRDVNPALPAIPISVYGPPSTSGTYDSFAELIMGPGCETNPEMDALKDSNKDEYERICHTLRGAPHYVEQGENDNLIIQRLATNPNSLGLFGFSYLDGNRDTIRDVPIDGVEATVASISGGSYPGSRPLFIYVKKRHIDVIRGLGDYVRAFVASTAPGGSLTTRGLIPLDAEGHAAAVRAAAEMPVLTAADLN
jgi:phosphate transport system substrate-binding protein